MIRSDITGIKLGTSMESAKLNNNYVWQVPIEDICIILGDENGNPVTTENNNHFILTQ